MNASLHRLVTFMQRVHGRDVACYETAFLAKSVERRLAATASPNADVYAERLAADGAEAELLFRSLQINHSEFFRNPLTFALLEQRVLPSFVAARRQSGGKEIRIWSAGCACGQEAYSVAILLEDLAAEGGQSVPYRIFASDLSEDQVAAADRGVYDRAAVRNVRLGHLDRYFTRQGDRYAIASKLRERVDFSVHDLLDERTSCPPACIYGDFDLIFCCNLLLYYSPDHQSVILNKLRQSLAANGCLVTGEAERDIVEQAGGFRAMEPSSTIFMSIRAGETSPLRSADLQSAVSQNCILQGVRQFEGAGEEQRPADGNSALRQIENLRCEELGPAPEEHRGRD